AGSPSKVTVTVPADVWEGEGAGLNCTTDVNKVDVSLFYWYKNTPNVFANAVYVYRDGYPTQTKAYNALENRAVVKPQGVTITGLTQSVIENIQVEVKCKVSRVKPKADIYWRKGLRGSLERGTTTSVSISDGIFQLEDTYKVSFSRNDHDTKLFCLVTRPGVSTDVWSNSHIVANVSYPPSTEVTQKTSGNPTEGGSVTLTCDIKDGRPRDDIKRVTWKKGGQEVISSGRNNISGRDLTISSLDHSKDDGSYTCAAENAAGMGRSGDAFQLDIHYKPTVSVKTPSPVVEGRPVTITCQSQGARPALTSVIWKKGQDIVTVTTDKYTGGTVQNPSLTITRATRTDAGQYTCQLNNVIGQDSKTVTLQVWCK
ncbi:hypothetical protein LSAT2_012661, partial [Lamellibrachia satsuma]